MAPKAFAMLLVPAFLQLALAGPVSAQETRVTVRVVANDAKIIGSGVGGAWVTIREVATGRVLAQGAHEGATGDTRLIMQEPRRRGKPVYDTPGAAGFHAVLDLETPTEVEIMASGPLGNQEAVQRASVTLLLEPGRHVGGDGVVLVLYGFKVALFAPEQGVATAGGTLDVDAEVEMMCGCPLTPGGLWDADRVEVRASLRPATGAAVVTRLGYAGQASRFRGGLQVPGEPGEYVLEVLAAQPGTANFGRATRRITVLATH